MFAAAIPQPSHGMTGGTLATGIRDALTASSFKAHMSAPTPKPKPKHRRPRVLAALPGKSSDEPLLWGVLAVYRPEGANGGRCVDARDLHRLACPDWLLPDWLTLCLPLAGVEAVAPWRNLDDAARGRIVVRGKGPIWLTLGELARVLPQMPGHEAKRFRNRLRRAGWKPSGGTTS
ncbi:hypothetical protein D3C85_1051560 [compost metagenome]